MLKKRDKTKAKCTIQAQHSRSSYKERGETSTYKCQAYNYCMEVFVRSWFGICVPGVVFGKVNYIIKFYGYKMEYLV